MGSQCWTGFYSLIWILLDFQLHPTNHPALSESLYPIWNPCFSSTKVKEIGYVKKKNDIAALKGLIIQDQLS